MRRHLAQLSTSFSKSFARARRLGPVALAALVLAGIAPAVAAQTRVASLLPWAADAFQDVGEGAVLVAAVPRSIGAPLAEGVVDLGSPHAPNLEALAVARPDLVLADGRFHRFLTEPLGRSGARVELLDGSSIQATFQSLLDVAAKAGVGEAMERKVHAAQAELRALQLDSPRRVLPLFGAPGEYSAITPRTWLGDLLGELGFVNVVADLVGRETFPGYVQVSEEVLATLKADCVLLVTHGNPEEVLASFRRDAAAGGVWAHLADRAIALDPARFAGNPGLEMPQAARSLLALGCGDAGDE